MRSRPDWLEGNAWDSWDPLSDGRGISGGLQEKYKQNDKLLVMPNWNKGKHNPRTNKKFTTQSHCLSWELHCCEAPALETSTMEQTVMKMVNTKVSFYTAAPFWQFIEGFVLFAHRTAHLAGHRRSFPRSTLTPTESSLNRSSSRAA